MCSNCGCNTLTQAAESISDLKLKKDSCCCGATKKTPCICMILGSQCSSVKPMCPCYRLLSVQTKDEKNAESLADLVERKYGLKTTITKDDLLKKKKERLEKKNAESWLTEGKCAICNSPSKFTVSTAVGERSFCCEACYADYMGLPIEEEGYYGLASETFGADGEPQEIMIDEKCGLCGDGLILVQEGNGQKYKTCLGEYCGYVLPMNAETFEDFTECSRCGKSVEGEMEHHPVWSKVCAECSNVLDHERRSFRERLKIDRFWKNAENEDSCFRCGCKNDLVYCELCEDSWCNDECREPSCWDKHYDYTCTRNAAETFGADKNPYYEVMVDSSTLNNLNGEFDGLRMELNENLDGVVLSLDYGEGGDEPSMTPSEAEKDYMKQISITTYDYEPDADEITGEWYGEPNTNIWRGTINFPEGKQREGGDFYLRVFGFKESELPYESWESQFKAEKKIMDYIQRTVEVYVRERDEEGNFHTVYEAELYDAETFESAVVANKVPTTPVQKAMLNRAMMEKAEIEHTILDLETKARLGLLDEKALMESLAKKFGAEGAEEIATYYQNFKEKHPELHETFVMRVADEDFWYGKSRKNMEEKLDKLGFDFDIVNDYWETVGYDLNPTYETCTDCEGEGIIITRYYPATRDDPADADYETCEMCEGKGKVLDNPLFDSENEEGSKAFMVAGIAIISALSFGIYRRLTE